MNGPRRLRKGLDMAELYPPIEPYDQGMLDAGDGNLVYWETCGNPAGKPALFVHGGPGQGCSPNMRRGFDPDGYRVVLFDQRGCGRSTPHASDPATDMSLNTTGHLLADMELLREHLGIGRWLLCGGSCGSTLILAYAERQPHRVSEIVISSVTTSRRSETDWLYRGAARFFPGEWERFRAGAGAAGRDGDLVAAYARLMEDPDPLVRSRAADDWSAWETRSSRWSRARRPACSATARRPTSGRSSASARTMAPTVRGWRRGRCCATPAGWPASRAS
jgi:proline iminopeptidase